MPARSIRGWYQLSSRALALVLLGTLYVSASEPLPPLPDDPASLETPEEDSSFDDWLSSEPGNTIPAMNLSTAENAIRIQHYGSLWANIYYASSRTEPGSFTLWGLSEQVGGESSLDLDVRRTRLGVWIDAPPIDVGLAEYDSRGRIEFDFLGQFLTENRAAARLRHAYWEMEAEDHRFLVGQTWDVMSPLQPGTLNFSVGWAAGNIGFRRAQFLAERRFDVGDETQLLIQGSLNQDIIADFPTDVGIRRESANWPVLEGRAAVSWPAAGDPQRRTMLGLSGHIGETGFDFLTAGPPPLSLPPADDVRIKTWSVNLDAEVPLSDSTTVRGELFRGANLSPFFGGIGQGVCPCLRKPIHSQGGWIELERQWNSRLESHFGAGIDDPADEDSLLGRTQNSFVFGNLILHITERFYTGWELTWWKTLYHDTRAGQINPALLTPSLPGEAATLEWMVRYDF
jgi:hypothetical protein